LLLSRFFYALWMVVDLSHEVVAERFGQGVGTSLDSPFHVDAERADLARVPLERLVNVLIVVVRAYAEREVTAGHLGDPACCGAGPCWFTPAGRGAGAPPRTWSRTVRT
jgi:hypothetical protein